MNAVRRMRALLRCGLAACLLAVAGGTAAAPVTVTDDRGTALTLPGAPARVVSLLPSITETVCALGACDRLVAVDTYSDWPASVQRLPHVGGLNDTRIERIAALRPDLVLVGDASRARDRLVALGLPVAVIAVDDMTQARRAMTTVARLLGLPEALAQARWQAVEAGVAQVAGRVPAAARGKSVYVEVATGPYAAGAASFIGELLARLGLANAVPPSLGPFPQLNPEFVVRARPDVIIATHRDPGLASRPGWQAIPAVRGQRVCLLVGPDTEALVRPGPRLAEAAALVVDRCLARVYR